MNFRKKTDNKLELDSRYQFVNINHLVSKVKLEEKKEKRKNLLITIAAISALAATGFVITQ